MSVRAVLYAALCAALTRSWRAVWNEPDLTAGSSAKGATCMAPNRWLEQYTLRSQAIQNAYADFSADCAANLITASPLSPYGCSLTPLVSTSAFASRTFDGDPVDATQFFGRPTILNENLLFPPFLGIVNTSWYNVGAYSYHSCACCALPVLPARAD